MNLKWIRLVPLLLFLASSASAELLSPRLNDLRHEGFELLFNMNYEEAEKKFRLMMKEEPSHPAGYVYMANAVWLHHLADLRRLQTGLYNKGNAFFNKEEDTADEDIEKQFRSYMDKGVEHAESMLSANKKDIAALYYLGIAKNIEAAFQATVKRSFFSALRNGSKGVGLHRQVLKIDPTVLDAQLAVGMYNYIAGSLPLAVKILVFFGGVRGSKKEGIRMLEEVAEKGNYAKDEAKALLIMLYGREKRLEDSLNLLRELAKTYPGNSMFRLELASTLGQLKRFEESFQAYDALLQDPAAYSYMPDFIHYQYANTLADAGLWIRSYENFLLAGRSPKAPSAMITMSHLNAGRCMDAAGRRQDALEQYGIVLQKPDAFEAHEQAKKYIKKPYQPE